MVCFGGEGQPVRPLWIWSALLSGGLPLALPVAGTLPLSSLNRRLNRSGSAVAGYAGASAITAARRMVVTDDDLFPPGTVSLNGLKLYGEEIGKVVSYAATAAQAAGSQLTPLFDQLLASEGGTHLHLEDLRFYEDGGIGGTIRGESVTMGSAYFMKKHHVSLPRDLKLKTGVFLAVDGQLIAIFAIKYQPSRNVEWALRAMRRNRITPVLATRSANITPALLKRKFRLDARPLYPDISTRLALSELTEGRGRPHAIIYRTADGLCRNGYRQPPDAACRPGRNGAVVAGRAVGPAAGVLFHLRGGLCRSVGPEFPVLFAAVAADGAAAGRTGAPLLIPFHTHAGRAKGSPGIFHKKDAESCICQVQKNSIYSPY